MIHRKVEDGGSIPALRSRPSFLFFLPIWLSYQWWWKQGHCFFLVFIFALSRPACGPCRKGIRCGSSRGTSWANDGQVEEAATVVEKDKKDKGTYSSDRHRTSHADGPSHTGNPGVQLSNKSWDDRDGRRAQVRAQAILFFAFGQFMGFGRRRRCRRRMKSRRREGRRQRRRRRLRIDTLALLSMPSIACAHGLGRSSSPCRCHPPT